MAPMMASDAPRDWAYRMRTGSTMPMPIKAALTAKDTASSVRLRSICASPMKPVRPGRLTSERD
jgi:hypothetical protein